MKLATWNVNSIRAREERLLRWLEAHRPDVAVPAGAEGRRRTPSPSCPSGPGLPRRRPRPEDLQRGRHPVAGRSRPDVERGFGDGGDDAQARLVAARVGGVHVVSAYVPNGQEVGSEKWAYKLDWLKRLRAWLDRRFAKTDLVALCGDFNVAPEARDVHDPAAWEPSVLFHPEAPRGPGERARVGPRGRLPPAQPRRRASTPGGTTGCWPSRRTRACASTTSS